jgi:hypothetical protein
VADSQWSHDTTSATEKDGALGSKMRVLGGGNFWGVSDGQGGPNGQGVAGYAISQRVGDVVGPQDVAVWTQVAETTNLIAGGVL